MSRRSLAEIIDRARGELAVNPTITVYEILEDGYELRWPVNPYIGLRASFNQLTESAKRLTASLGRLGDDLSKAMRGES